MKVLVSGATGFVGRRLVDHLAAAGHEPVAVSRDPSVALRKLPALVAAYGWEPGRGGFPQEALQGVEAVVHLAGEPVTGLWTRGKRRAIEESRVRSTEALVAALARAERRPRVLVSASAVGYYGDRGEQVLTEGVGPGEGFLSRVCARWEEAARPAEELGLRVVRLRIGLVLGLEGGALGAMLPAFKLGLGGRLGRGDQWWPWIHQDDLLALIEWALANERLAGAVNAAAPQPRRQADFARALARAVGRPALLPAPTLLLRAALGGFADELLSSRRAVPHAAEQAGFRFAYAELEEALSALLHAGERQPAVPHVPSQVAPPRSPAPAADAAP